jgi:hypothetical protein
MMYVLGDIHGTMTKLKWMRQFLQPEDIVIQVGDFGFYKSVLNEFHDTFPKGYMCKLYAIAGNHENYNIIDKWSKTDITDVGGNLFHVPRGYVMEYKGKRMGFIGGAESIDKAWRKEGYDWFPQERITREEVDLLYKNAGTKRLDYLFSHTPTITAIQGNFTPLDPATWMLPLDWKDESSIIMDEIHNKLRPHDHYCGHMHRSVSYGSVRILNIDEVKAL